MFAIAIVAIVVIGVVGGMVWGVAHPLGLDSGKEPKKMGGTTSGSAKVIGAAKEPKALPGDGGMSYLDAGGDSTRDDILAVVAPRRDDEALGEAASAVAGELEKAEFMRDAIVSVMEDEFGRESLTWDKFSAPVEAALADVYSNSARVANLMQMFDTGDYQRILRLDKAGQLVAGSRQEARLSSMRASLQEMRELTEASEAMLAELERLHSALVEVAGSHREMTTEEIAEEIRNLTDDTREYV